MNNPILQMLGSNNAGQIAALKSLMSGKTPEGFFQMLMNNNSQFASFVNENKGKSAEQIARAYGVDPALLSSLLK